MCAGRFDRKLQPLGKFNRKTIEKIIYTQLGKNRGSVLVGPKFGVDNAVISLGNGIVMVATCDPLSFIPELGARDSARISVDLLASDLTTSGLTPQYGIFDMNLPPEMTRDEFAEYWKAFSLECKRLGISIVGGHTGRYMGCGYTIVGGGILFSIGRRGFYLTPEMAAHGDDIILTKGAAIEATGVLTRVFPKSVRKAIGLELYGRARHYLNKLSTVEDALTAVSVGLHEGGVTAMHDATEGGVVSAILELAEASHKGAEIELASIRVTEETAAVCQLFQIDPLASLSEGSLLLTTNPSRTSKVMSRLNTAGIRSTVIGHITSKSPWVYASSATSRNRLRYPKFDPYWRAYAAAKRKGWR